ncbi:lipopolysaccharide biosynthesis protein [Desulfobacca acetoxidans]|nr:oligosaccharide flippase family protein [Desulfobacca acetoxidans]
MALTILPPKGSFIRNVFTLMTGTVVAQAIPIMASPILTRLYNPEEFGSLALFSAVASMIGVIATGRYELAIMLPQEEEEAINLVGLSLAITLCLSTITFLVVAAFNREIANLLGNPNFSIWLFAIPVTVFLTGLQNTFNYWFNRKKRYAKLSLCRITQSSVNVSANIGMGVAGWQKSGLIGGLLIGQSFSTAYLVWQAWRRDRSKSRLVNKSLMAKTARTYKDFPTINSLHAFSDMLQNNGVIFLLSSFFGPSILGFYFLSVRILKTPLMFIGSSVAQVFYQKATETFNAGGNLQGLVKKTMFSLMAIAFPIFLLILFLAPYLFSHIFGKEWREAGFYSQILAPWFFLNFIFSPITQIPIIVNRQKMGFMITSIGNLLILISIFYGGFIAKDIYLGLYLLSTILSVYMICFAFWLYKAAGQVSKIIP